jgi:hypothetical protein
MCLMASLLTVGHAVSQMVNPGIDKKGEPFSYPSAPTDQLALPGPRFGVEITPEGYLYTGYGELIFLLGYPPHPARQRIRTLEEGHLPIFHYEYRDGTVRYQLTVLTRPLSNNRPDHTPVALIQVVATNLGITTRTSYFSVAFRYSGEVNQADGVPDHRFQRPSFSLTPGGYYQPGVSFDPRWVYGFCRSYATRSGSVVYTFPVGSKPALWLTLNQRYEKPRELHILPDTPVLSAQFKLRLEPGQTRALVFKMPVRPLDLSQKSALAQLDALNFSVVEREVKTYWEAILNRGIRINLPERKVTETFRASLLYAIQAIDHVGEDSVQNVNKLQYHAFWLRDASHIMSAYDVAGYPDLTRQCLLFFLKQQDTNGLFISQPGQYDGWGQALWAFGRYYQFTQDISFAKTVYPAVQKAVEWLARARMEDSFHLMPAANPHDDEFSWMTGHVTGHNFWALNGLHGAIVLARAVGTERDVKAYQQLYTDFRGTLVSALKRITADTGGYIPPALDVRGGHDWGNLDTLYPEILFAPDNPMVSATLRHARAEYAEGIMTYGPRLHLYLGLRNTEAELIRGDQEQVVKDLYAILIHTSSTHAGWEMVRPAAWTTRDFAQDLAPHGWFAAEYVLLIRNMLVREEDDDLHLFSALSPSWCQPDAVIEVNNAPTYFGQLNLKATFRRDGMLLTLSPKFRQPPKRIVVHLPWFVTPASVLVDGSSGKFQGHSVTMPATTRKLLIRWANQATFPVLSFTHAVRQYLVDYEKHYRNFRALGSLRNSATNETQSCISHNWLTH